jgi:hypothetical protein
MSLSATDYLLWVASAVLLVLTAGSLVRHKLVRELPLFSLYVLFQVCRCFMLAGTHRIGYAEYFYSYWAAQAISTVLGFGVLYELYCKLFCNYDAIQQLGGVLFGFAAVFLLAVAVLTAASAPGADSAGLIKALVLLERSVRVMQCGLLLFLFLLSFYFGLAWRNYLFGIALGFGVFASIELVAIAVRSQIGASADTAWSHVNGAAYSCGVLIWVCYLLAPKRAPQQSGAFPHNELEKWNQALLEILER